MVVTLVTKMTDPDRFQGKYRIPSARWAAWDYGCNAAYFVTICTAQGACDFGQVFDGMVCLTPLGQAAVDCWAEIPAHFPFVIADEFVVMPNHVHGIIVINNPDIAETQNVETQNFASLHAQPQPGNQFGPQSRNLASIVRGYKVGVTKYARLHSISFAWQARYHDHVIRNATEYKRIHAYILENPQTWAEDTFHCT
jgi:putative transposase